MPATDLQQPFDCAVVVQTTLRPSLLQAVNSVFAQHDAGRIHLLIGVDVTQGELCLIDRLRADCPAHIALTVFNPGYSTSQRHGGLYTNHFGGALRTILSYAANSHLVTYLDDDNWWTPDHLASLSGVIAGNAWAFSRRHLIDKKTDRYLCRDDFASMGPGKGVWAPGFGGLVDTNCYMMDKIRCHEIFPAWSLSSFEGGVGEDRMVFERLRQLPYADSGLYTVYYRVALASQHPYVLWKMRQAGVPLAELMTPEELPPDSAWEECARFDANAGSDAAQQPPPRKRVIWSSS